ncbi:hypothetical protein PC116_g26215 [Phytophthora cactorum]|uniref:Uncharacterized protein n=1 Tax=Phytophthora cactorum TaxID=29920 RepID=A0A8T1AMU6_9STRA|nr:hypothetical protein PC111_g21601 [Phytophthora cactorum]KAG2796942.1 hypothetical protein PC112_g21996 [Phytophthora cactorum]KAG2882966.1 hypothetical protein PC115_g21785 [Phytophthora cactorum]KAG2969249.1 hypothetical protein PC119_g23980 [Phytophthora cactorum]KAG2987605.1 hypothetical protein PC120_g23576 [Phytophthora cactorum]
MRQGGAKRKKILRYLKESSGKPILPEDVSNMITKMRREFHTAPDDNVRVTEVLEDFSEDISHETHGGPISRSHLCRRYAWHKYQQITTLQLHGDGQIRQWSICSAFSHRWGDTSEYEECNLSVPTEQ